MKYLSGGVPDIGSLINLLISPNSALELSGETLSLFFLIVDCGGNLIFFSTSLVVIWLANA
jgi:hypothetical protein